MTTIAGPPGQDEEEIVGSDEEDAEEGDYSPEDLSDGGPAPAKPNISRDSDSLEEESAQAKPNISRRLFINSASSEEESAPAKPKISRRLFIDSDSSEEESETGEGKSMSSSNLLLSYSRTRPTSSFVEKFLSPKVSMSRNVSLVDQSVNNSSLVCEVCSLETEYSWDMGIEEEEEEKFEV